MLYNVFIEVSDIVKHNSVNKYKLRIIIPRNKMKNEIQETLVPVKDFLFFIEDLMYKHRAKGVTICRHVLNPNVLSSYSYPNLHLIVSVDEITIASFWYDCNTRKKLISITNDNFKRYIDEILKN